MSEIRYKGQLILDWILELIEKVEFLRFVMPISAAGGHLAIKQAQNRVVIAFQPSHIIVSVKELALRKISRDLEQV